MEYERLPKSGGSRKQYLARHRIAKSNMSRWRRKKENQRCSRVKDNLSPEQFRRLGFPNKFCEHTLEVYLKTLSNLCAHKLNVFIVIYAEWWELTQKEERKFERREFSDVPLISEELVQIFFIRILTYGH